MGWSPSIAVIGAGIGGICAAIQLQEQLGLTNFTLYEKEEEAGGTWWVNSYPGCGCDIASHAYSFSFAPNPNWSRKFSGSKEILDYLISVVDKYNIRKRIQFNTQVIKAEYNKDKQNWTIIMKQNDKIQEIVADIVIISTGALRDPNIPDEIISNFDGQWVHSAQWKKDFEYEDKSVAVIGSGASAVQIIPTIAPKVKQLYVYQRTPTWISPKNDITYSSIWKSICNWVPPVHTLYRWYLFWKSEAGHLAFQRRGILTSAVSKIARYAFESVIRNRVPDEKLRKALTPTYEVGCKRIVLSDNYLETFMLPNVELITDSISKVEGKTIYSGDGTKTKVDSIVLATGFRIELFFSPMKLYGRGGEELLDYWTTGKPEAYYGLAAHNFPNVFFLVGPNSGLGHNSIIFMIECQVNAIVRLVGEMMAKDIRSIEVKEEVQRKYNDNLQKDLKETVWASGCKSWYYNEEKGVNFTLWPFGCVEFWKQTRKISLDEFDTRKKD